MHIKKKCHIVFNKINDSIKAIIIKQFKQLKEKEIHNTVLVLLLITGMERDVKSCS